MHKFRRTAIAAAVMAISALVAATATAGTVIAAVVYHP